MAPDPSPQHEPEHTPRQANLSTLFAAALAALVILTLLGHNRLTDWDEGIYAQVSRQILSTQHFNPASWLVLHWNTGLWLEKPPLTFWITAVFYKLFGVSEFTARLGSALSGIALVAMLHAWCIRTWDSLSAWLSTFILLSTFGFLHIARVGETDTLLSFGCMLALIGLTEVLRDPLQPGLVSNPTHGWYLYWAGFAIALMSKGAASGGLFLTLLLLLLDPTLRRLRASFFYGLLLFLALVLPWHLYLLHRFGHFFVAEYLNLHVIGRVTHQYDGHITHWWYYLRVLLFSAPPWVLLYPIALYDALRQPRLRPLQPIAFFALIQIIAFSFVQTRLPHYVAPAYAPLSALVAIWIAGWSQTKNLVPLSKQKDAVILSKQEDVVPLSKQENAVILSGARSAQSKDPDAVRPARTPSALPAHTLLRFRLQLFATLAALWILTALLTAHPRSQLHSPRLPNGVVTPNNREGTALLKQVFQHPSPLVANTPGPLLDARPGTYNPIPTVIFYANRPVQQVELQPLPANGAANASSPTNATMDIYSFNPLPLAQALPSSEPRLILIARPPSPQIPANYTFQPIASSPTLEVGRISRQP